MPEDFLVDDLIGEQSAIGVESDAEAPVKALSDRVGSVGHIGRWAVDDAEGVEVSFDCDGVEGDDRVVDVGDVERGGGLLERGGVGDESGGVRGFLEGDCLGVDGVSAPFLLS